MNVEKVKLINSILGSIGLISILWGVKFVETLLNVSFISYGMLPLEVSGLAGILTTPFIHADLNHLYSNSISLVVLLFLLLQQYPKVAFRVLILIILLSGIWMWLAARPVYHVGASGVVYGLTAFIFFSGMLKKDKSSMALALLVAFLYGSLVWGIFPVFPGVSWEGHLFGGLAGIVAAFYFREKTPLALPKSLTDDKSNLPYWMYNVEGDLKDEYKGPFR